MGERRRRINRICHWIGVASAAIPLGGAVYILFKATVEPDLDERNEFVGGALFLALAGLVLYLVPRVIGWVTAELVD